MILIGWATQARMDRQWRLLARLSGHFLDVVEGLPTLKVFGRAKAQAASIRAITGAYRRATLRTLRIAFLSSFALELLATISVALVAVGIGMRLVHGELDLYTGLMVLVLAPEAYLPLRQVGAQYHAAAEGLSAAEEIFAVLETPLPTPGTAPAPEGTALAVEDLVVRHPGRTADSLPATSFEVRPGETVALVGPSGAGKSTLLSVLLGFTEPHGGRALVDGRDIASLSPRAGGSGSPGFRSTRICSPAPSPRTYGWRGRTRTTPRCAPPWAMRARWTSSTRSRTAWRPGSASPVPGSRPASASASRSPAPSSPTVRSCSWTSPPRTWTAPPRRPSWPRSAGSRSAVRSCSSSTGRRCWRWRTGWCGCRSRRGRRPVRSRGCGACGAA